MLTLLLAAALADCPAIDATGALPPASPPLGVDKVEKEWCLKGIDLPAQVGPDSGWHRQIVFGRSDGVYRIVYRFQHGRFSAPRNWTRVKRWEPTAPANGRFTALMFQFRGRRLISVAANPAWAVGNAICITESGPVDLYLVGKEAPGTEEKEAIERETSQGFSSTMCISMMPGADGRNHFRYHDSGGGFARALTGFFGDEPVELVPPGPVEPYRPLPIETGSAPHRLEPPPRQTPPEPLERAVAEAG